MKLNVVAVILLPAILCLFFRHAEGNESYMVQTFEATFKNYMLSGYNPRNYGEAFSTYGVTDQNWADTFYNYVYDNTKSIDQEQAATIAKLGRNAILWNFRNMPSGSFLTTYAISVGELLQLLGIMNRQNVNQLAIDCSTVFKNAIDKSYDQNRPDTKIKTLVDGYVTFVTNQGVFNRVNLPVIGTSFAQAVFALPSYNLS